MPSLTAVVLAAIHVPALRLVPKLDSPIVYTDPTELSRIDLDGAVALSQVPRDG